MELWLVMIAGGVVLAAILVYVGFMIFLPEWVGITGKTAIENEKSHRHGEEAKDNAFLAKLHGDKDPNSKKD